MYFSDLPTQFLSPNELYLIVCCFPFYVFFNPVLFLFSFIPVLSSLSEVLFGELLIKFSHLMDSTCFPFPLHIFFLALYLSSLPHLIYSSSFFPSLSVVWRASYKVVSPNGFFCPFIFIFFNSPPFFSASPHPCISLLSPFLWYLILHPFLVLSILLFSQLSSFSVSPKECRGEIQLVNNKIKKLIVSNLFEQLPGFRIWYPLYPFGNSLFCVAV